MIGIGLRMRNAGAAPAASLRTSVQDAVIIPGVSGGTRNAFRFYAIALGLALVVRLLAPVLGRSSLPVTMLTPAIAAAIMLAFVAPEGGLRSSFAGLGLTSFGLMGWPLALAGPAVIFLVGLAVLAFLGLTTLAAPQVEGSGAGVALNLLAELVGGTLFALCEEIGWRGYMLPRMRGFGAITAMLVVGFLQGVWHLPLLLTTDLYHAAGDPRVVAPLFLTTLTLAGVFFGYLRVTTGSIWPVAGAHAAVNVAWGISMEVAQTKSTLVLEYLGGESGVLMICGLLAVDAVLIGKLRKAARDVQA
jgi:membrane protease YdiL (CAAX protease family)